MHDLSNVWILGRENAFTHRTSSAAVNLQICYRGLFIAPMLFIRLDAGMAVLHCGLLATIGNGSGVFPDFRGRF